MDLKEFVMELAPRTTQSVITRLHRKVPAMQVPPVGDPICLEEANPSVFPLCEGPKWDLPFKQSPWLGRRKASPFSPTDRLEQAVAALIESKGSRLSGDSTRYL